MIEMTTDSWSFWDKRAVSVMSDGDAIQARGDEFVNIPVLSGLILDAGCGYGRFAIPLAKKGNNVVALDASPAMLDRLVKQIRRNNLNNIYPIRASITDLPFKSDLFDGVICRGTFYYIPSKEWNNAIYEFARVLKKNGGLYIQFINLSKGRIKERLGEIALLFGKKRTWAKTYYLPKFMIKRLLDRYFETVVTVEKTPFIFLCKNVKKRFCYNLLEIRKKH